jgi:hypothetical protein
MKTPSLSGFSADFAALSNGFLLPPARRRRWRHWLALLPCAAGVAVGSAALLVGVFTLSMQVLLGPARLSQAFPYLQPALDLFVRDRHWLLALVLTALSLGGLLLQLGAMAPALRRRWLALAGLLGLLVLSTAVDVAFTEGNGAVMDALNRRSASAFWGTAAGLVVIYLLTLPLQFFNTYGQQRFALAWRDASTGSMERGYLEGLTYYRLEADGPLATQVDNPDQRIAEDIQRSVASSTDLAFGFSASLLALAAYIVVLVGISNTLVLTLLIATLIGNGVIVKLVRRLAGLNFRQQALEAEFRFAQAHIAEAMGIGLLEGHNGWIDLSGGHGRQAAPGAGALAVHVYHSAGVLICPDWAGPAETPPGPGRSAQGGEVFYLRSPGACLAAPPPPSRPTPHQAFDDQFHPRRRSAGLRARRRGRPRRGGGWGAAQSADGLRLRPLRSAGGPAGFGLRHVGPFLPSGGVDQAALRCSRRQRPDGVHRSAGGNGCGQRPGRLEGDAELVRADCSQSPPATALPHALSRAGVAGGGGSWDHRRA